MVRSGPPKAGSFLQSFVYAMRGVSTGFASERNFRIQCLYALIVFGLLLWFQPALLGAVLALASVCLLLAAELANSALERVVDIVSPHESTPAGEAKDMAAAAVLLVSLASAGIVLSVLWPELQEEKMLGLGGLFLGMFGLRLRRGAVT